MGHSNISSLSKFSGIGSLNPMPSAISLKYLLNILATVSGSLIIESFSHSIKSILVLCLELRNGLMVGQKCWFFWTTFASLSEVLLFFLHFSDIDTLVSDDSVPFIIFRTRMFIFNITHHVPFIHHFQPFTIHIGYIIFPYGFRFQWGVIIHDIIQTIYKMFKACIDSIFVVKVERIQQMI